MVKRILNNDFDLEENNEVMAGMMSGFIEASQHQANIALELTKLIVDKNPTNINEEKVFSIFKRASKVVAESSLMK